MYMWLYVLASMNTLQKLKLLIIIFYRYNSVVSQQGKIDSCNGCLVYFFVLNIHELPDAMQPNADHDPKF